MRPPNSKFDLVNLTLTSKNSDEQLKILNSKTYFQIGALALSCRHPAHAKESGRNLRGRSLGGLSGVPQFPVAILFGEGGTTWESAEIPAAGSA